MYRQIPTTKMTVWYVRRDYVFKVHSHFVGETLPKKNQRWIFHFSSYLVIELFHWRCFNDYFFLVFHFLVSSYFLIYPLPPPPVSKSRFWLCLGGTYLVLTCDLNSDTVLTCALNRNTEMRYRIGLLLKPPWLQISLKTNRSMNMHMCDEIAPERDPNHIYIYIERERENERERERWREFE